jgi:hypothetical protein
MMPLGLAPRPKRDSHRQTSGYIWNSWLGMAKRRAGTIGQARFQNKSRLAAME